MEREIDIKLSEVAQVVGLIRMARDLPAGIFQRKLQFLETTAFRKSSCALKVLHENNLQQNVHRFYLQLVKHYLYFK